MEFSQGLQGIVTIREVIIDHGEIIEIIPPCLDQNLAFGWEKIS
jgi:hypothetical protein